MRDRLIELIRKARKEMQKEELTSQLAREYFIAEYLLANGAIVPPVEPGQQLYEIVKMPKHTFISEFPMMVEPYQIIYRNIIGGYSCIPFEALGKTVFLTKEEAEKALAERSGE